MEKKGTLNTVSANVLSVVRAKEKTVDVSPPRGKTIGPSGGPAFSDQKFDGDEGCGSGCTSTFFYRVLATRLNGSAPYPKTGLDYFCFVAERQTNGRGGVSLSTEGGQSFSTAKT